MLNLIVASAYFLLIHFGVSGTKLRDTLVARFGEGPYRGAFALASLLGLVWMGYAYRSAPTIPLWGLLLGFRPAAYVLVLIALIFVVVGIATPSPTRVGMESKLAQGSDIARGMVRITRHPFLWGGSALGAGPPYRQRRSRIPDSLRFAARARARWNGRYRRQATT